LYLFPSLSVMVPANALDTAIDIISMQNVNLFVIFMISPC